MKPGTTKKQTKVIEFIKDFIAETGYPPTIREIARHLGLTGPKSVQKHLAALERKGFIKRAAKRPRAIKLAEDFQKNGLPIVGAVAAGKPLLSEENIEGVFSLEAKSKNHFFLRIKGDSMIDAHIADGDLAMIRPQPSAENGEIVVAMVNGEATVKRFFKKEGHVVLKPENRSLSPITVKGGDFKIIGKVVMVVRNI